MYHIFYNSADLQFVVLASDGLWDVYSGDGVLRAMRALLSAGTPHAQLARSLSSCRTKRRRVCRRCCVASSDARKPR